VPHGLPVLAVRFVNVNGVARLVIRRQNTESPHLSDVFRRRPEIGHVEARDLLKVRFGFVYGRQQYFEIRIVSALKNRPADAVTARALRERGQQLQRLLRTGQVVKNMTRELQPGIGIFLHPHKRANSSRAVVRLYPGRRPEPGGTIAVDHVM
jgi:hypothetical protein